jgi:hypothetical protein
MILSVFFTSLAWMHFGTSQTGADAQGVGRADRSIKPVGPGTHLLTNQQGPSPAQDQDTEPSPARDQDTNKDRSVRDDDAPKSRIDPREAPYSFFREGTEATIQINGNEVREVPHLRLSRVIDGDSIVLISPWRQYGSLEEGFHSVYTPYQDAVLANDFDAINKLVERELVIRVKTPLRVRVVTHSGGGTMMFPLDQRGMRDVEILEGKWKGRVVCIPAVNLRLEPRPDIGPSVLPENVTVGDVVELVGKPGDTSVKFHLAPRSGKASILTPVPVKAEVKSIEENDPLPYEVKIMSGPNKGMDVDVDSHAVRALTHH